QRLPVPQWEAPAFRPSRVCLASGCRTPSAWLVTAPATLAWAAVSGSAWTARTREVRSRLSFFVFLTLHSCDLRTATDDRTARLPSAEQKPLMTTAGPLPSPRPFANRTRLG